MAHKRSRTKQNAIFSPSKGVEPLLKDFIGTLTEASYQLAVKCGFQGSFIHFLSDFQEVVEKVIEQKKPVVGLEEEQEPQTGHHQDLKKLFKGWDQYE
jgi:hypothetical protein